MDERYTNQWYGWFLESFGRLVPAENFKVVGDTRLRTITSGSFVDSAKSMGYKLRQLLALVDELQWVEWATVFFMDIWFPGVEALAFLRDAMGKRLRFVGMLHAGTYDPYDFCAQRGMTPWAAPAEVAWITMMDEVLVATEYHASIIRKRCPTAPITLAGYPVYQDAERRLRPKENLVVWPHGRFGPEKAPEEFDEIERLCRERGVPGGTSFVKTAKVAKTKVGYYDLLARAKVAVSTAYQETFGISMLEAWNLGCIPVAPDRLSYRETLCAWPKYRTLEEAAELVCKALGNYELPAPSGYGPSVDHLVRRVLL